MRELSIPCLREHQEKQKALDDSFRTKNGGRKKKKKKIRKNRATKKLHIRCETKP